VKVPVDEPAPTRAFSPDGRFYDSLMAAGAVVEHTTSWLTINPMKGCQLGCAYCFRARWHPDNRPSRQFDVADGVLQLLEHPDFVVDRTPVSVNVSSTDSMLPTVRASTLEAVQLLDAEGLRNPVGIITKLRIPDYALKVLAELKYVRPVVFVSLAYLPREIEPVPTRPRVENLRRLMEARISNVLYLRPIVEGWNDSRESIGELLRIGDRYSDAVCIGGLRLSPEIARELAAAGMEVPVPDVEDEFHEKAVPPRVEAMIEELREQHGLEVPIYKHTSCAVSKIMEWPNYNALFERAAENCVASCPSTQVRRCHDAQG
jgi:DNA repair photolyase